MTNLIHARLIRYFRSATFPIAMLCSLALGIMEGFSEFEYIHSTAGYLYSVWLLPALDDIRVILAVGVVTSVIFLELGKEHSLGTLRNVLIAGHSKKTVCAAEVISSIAVTACIFIAFIIPTIICGKEFFFNIPTSAFLLIIADMLLFFIVWSVVITAFTLLFTNRTIAVAVIVPLIILFSTLNVKLREYYYNTDPPVTTMTYLIYDSDGQMHEEVRTYKNQFYLEGLPKTLVDVEHEINPFSRLYNICNYAYLNHPENAEDEAELKENHTTERQLVYDALIMSVIGMLLTLGAATAFERKDLK